MADLSSIDSSASVFNSGRASFIAAVTQGADGVPTHLAQLAAALAESSTSEDLLSQLDGLYAVIDTGSLKKLSVSAAFSFALSEQFLKITQVTQATVTRLESQISTLQAQLTTATAEIASLTALIATFPLAVTHADLVNHRVGLEAQFQTLTESVRRLETPSTISMASSTSSRSFMGGTLRYTTTNPHPVLEEKFDHGLSREVPVSTYVKESMKTLEAGWGKPSDTSISSDMPTAAVVANFVLTYYKIVLDALSPLNPEEKGCVLSTVCSLDRCFPKLKVHTFFGMACIHFKLTPSDFITGASPQMIRSPGGWAEVPRQLLLDYLYEYGETHHVLVDPLTSFLTAWSKTTVAHNKADNELQSNAYVAIVIDSFVTTVDQHKVELYLSTTASVPNYSNAYAVNKYKLIEVLLKKFDPSVFTFYEAQFKKSHAAWDDFYALLDSLPKRVWEITNSALLYRLSNTKKKEEAPKVTPPSSGKSASHKEVKTPFSKTAAPVAAPAPTTTSFRPTFTAPVEMTKEAANATFKRLAWYFFNGFSKPVPLTLTSPDDLDPERKKFLALSWDAQVKQALEYQKSIDAVTPSKDVKRK
jgi:hypothetical protein